MVVRECFGVPRSPAFLRVFLLGLSGLETATLVADPEGRLAFHRGSLLPLVSVRSVPHAVGGSWVVFWDGSFSPAGDVIGVAIGHTADQPLVQVGVPVSAMDASRSKGA